MGENLGRGPAAGIGRMPYASAGGSDPCPGGARSDAVAPAPLPRQTVGMPIASRHLLAAVALLIGSVAGAQDAPPGGPKVGDLAPDFTLPAATRAGVNPAPVKLSDLRGQTVVLAFFPKARTGG